MIDTKILIILIILFFLFQSSKNKSEKFTSLCKLNGEKNCKKFICSAKNYKNWLACTNNGKDGLYPRLKKSQVPEDKNNNFIQDNHMCSKKYSIHKEYKLPTQQCIKKCLDDNNCLSYAIRPNVNDNESNCRIYTSCNSNFPKGTDDTYETRLDTGKFYSNGEYKIGKDKEGYIHRLKKPGISTNGLCSDNISVQVPTRTKDTANEIMTNRKLCFKDETKFGCVFYPQSCGHICDKNILENCKKIYKIDQDTESNCNNEKCGKFYQEMKEYRDYYYKTLQVDRVRVRHLALKKQILNRYPRCTKCNWKKRIKKL